MTQAEGTDVDRAVRLLLHEQNKKAVQKAVQWFWNVGGLKKSFGILTGNLRGKRTWRYCMGDDLLAALVQLADRDEQGLPQGCDHSAPYADRQVLALCGDAVRHYRQSSASIHGYSHRP